MQDFDVDTASDGNRALEMTGQFEYALVILDVQMPMYTGIELLRLLRKQHIHHRVPILALTGDTSERTRQALIRDGIDGVLSKPVDFPALRAEISRLL